jgi:hypothetical protein
VRYTGRPRKGTMRFCFANQRAVSPARIVSVVHGKYGVQGSRRLEDGGAFAVVVIVSTVEPFTLPAAIFVGFSAQVAPESPAGTAHVKFTSAGNGELAGVVVKFNVTVAGAPAVTVTLPEVAWVKIKSVTLNAKFPEVPPPGAGLMTDTLKVPVAAISAAAIAAVI